MKDVQLFLALSISELSQADLKTSSANCKIPSHQSLLTDVRNLTLSYFGPFIAYLIIHLSRMYTRVTTVCFDPRFGSQSYSVQYSDTPGQALPE